MKRNAAKIKKIKYDSFQCQTASLLSVRMIYVMFIISFKLAVITQKRQSKYSRGQINTATHTLMFFRLKMAQRPKKISLIFGDWFVFLLFNQFTGLQKEIQVILTEYN